MSSDFHPTSDPQAYQATIGTIFVDMTVCLVKVKGLKTATKADIRDDGPGGDGGAITHQGVKLARWKMELQAWDDEGHRIVFGIVSMLRKIAKKGGNGGSRAIAVQHPVLETADVHTMYVEEVEGPEFDEGTKMTTASWSCVEFRLPPKNKNATQSVKAADVPDALTIHEGGGKNFDVARTPKPSKAKPKP